MRSIALAFAASLAAFPPLSSRGASPPQGIEAFDARVPVPMPAPMANHQKENMRGHLEAVQGILEGLQRKDFAAVETAAKRMGFTEEMGRMCERMGAGAPGFSERAIKFHKSADGIAHDAHERSAAKVQRDLSRLLRQCTACHATYREQIVSEAEYASLVKAFGSRK